MGRLINETVSFLCLEKIYTLAYDEELGSLSSFTVAINILYQTSLLGGL